MIPLSGGAVRIPQQPSWTRSHWATRFGFKPTATLFSIPGPSTRANPIALTLFLSDGTTVVTTGSTNGSGVYQFSGLLPGDYIVHVNASNFGSGQPLGGKESITGGGDPDDNVDNDDNGIDNAAPATNGIRSLPITLAYNTEITAGSGNDTNNTLDLGFKPSQADVAITKIVSPARSPLAAPSPTP